MSDHHLSAGELTAWCEEGAGDRDRIVAHLAGCAVCREAAADVERLRPADSHPVRFAPDDFVALGYLAGRPAERRVARQWIWLAATAALVLLAVIPLRRDRAGDAPGTMRGPAPSIALVRPVNATVSADELVFEWTGTSAGDRVRLNVVDLDRPDQPLIEREVAGLRYEPLPDERRRFQPGQSLHWYVEVRGGTAARTSPAARFRVR